MIVVCASESPRSAIISTRSRKLSLNRRYQRTHRMMISRSKWRPLKSSSTFNMLGQVHRGLICRRICATPTLRTRTLDRAPQPFDENVVHEAAASVHRNRDAGRHKLAGENLGGESGALDALLFVKRRFAWR